MVTQEKNNNELDALLISFKNTKDEKKKRMLHLKIVEEAMVLVKKIANTISMQSGIANEDLVQVGSLGLIKAIEFYKLDMNTKFKTYATYFIKGEIKHYLRDKASIIKAPRELQELMFKINNARKKLNESGIEDPSNEQIAEYLEIPVAKINEVTEIERCKSTLSLDQSLMQDDEDISLLDKIPAGILDNVSVISVFINSPVTEDIIKRFKNTFSDDIRGNRSFLPSFFLKFLVNLHLLLFYFESCNIM